MARNWFKVTRISGIVKTIKKLQDDESEGKILLGIANGIDLDRCVYLGSMYCEDFSEKVIGYQIKKGQKYPVEVKFYANITN